MGRDLRANAGAASTIPPDAARSAAAQTGNGSPMPTTTNPARTNAPVGTAAPPGARRSAVAQTGNGSPIPTTTNPARTNAPVGTAAPPGARRSAVAQTGNGSPIPAATNPARADTPVDAAAGPTVLPITARGVVVARAGRNLIDGIDLTLSGGGVTAILGPNGAGKSMLLRVLGHLVAPDRGVVEWAGREPDRARAPCIGFVFQKPVLLRRSVRANVEYALSAIGIRGATRRARAGQVLEAASLHHLAERPARLLSGGEQQRLALARALSTKPQALFLDEPTSSLDPAAALAIETLIDTARADGMTIALVTHDIAQAKRLAGEVAFVHHGRITERTPASDFFANPASEPARAYLEGRIVV